MQQEGYSPSQGFNFHIIRIGMMMQVTLQSCYKQEVRLC